MARLCAHYWCLPKKGVVITRYPHSITLKASKFILTGSRAWFHSSRESVDVRCWWCSPIISLSNRRSLSGFLEGGAGPWTSACHLLFDGLSPPRQQWIQIRNTCYTPRFIPHTFLDQPHPLHVCSLCLLLVWLPPWKERMWTQRVTPTLLQWTKCSCLKLCVCQYNVGFICSSQMLSGYGYDTSHSQRVVRLS